MAPAIRTGARRLIAALAIWAHAVLAYELHRFDGWTWRGLMVLDWALLVVVVRLVLAEGRERERAARG